MQCFEPPSIQRTVYFLQVLRLLSCAAGNHSIYVVVNIPEISPCAGADCPSDGAFFYNTDIAFDRSGALVAR